MIIKSLFIICLSVQNDYLGYSLKFIRFNYKDKDQIYTNLMSKVCLKGGYTFVQLFIYIPDIYSIKFKFK